MSSKNKNQQRSNPPAEKPEVTGDESVAKTFEKSVSGEDTGEAKAEEAAKVEEQKDEETRPIAPQPKVSQEPEVAFANVTDTVTMIFPRAVMLQHAPGKKVTFKAGTREVPADLADHPYLAANGVERYKK